MLRPLPPEMKSRSLPIPSNISNSKVKTPFPTTSVFSMLETQTKRNRHVSSSSKLNKLEMEHLRQYKLITIEPSSTKQAPFRPNIAQLCQFPTLLTLTLSFVIFFVPLSPKSYQNNHISSATSTQYPSFNQNRIDPRCL